MKKNDIDEMDKKRDPEKILQEIKEQEEELEETDIKRRGKLKIFFGYAAGVGKTYAMLDTAGEAKAAGADVVAGYIEPHARPDTIALLEGLEVLPPKLIDHKGIKLREFDLDAALWRKPEILLVDELAHTNAEGCRHRKRFQDIQELLDAGIDVYTTVNVQHLESLHDIVASITHIRVNERVPDRIFDEADKIELVDIEPEELLTRLAAGKIYGKNQAGRAMSNFFTKENLTALREIALRRTADQVNKAVMKERQAAGRDYYTGEHVLVCLSPSPTNEKVIRTAARMAGAFRAELSAVVVETLEAAEREDKVRKTMENNITLAKQFGAKVVTLYGDDIAEQIAGYAKNNGVSKIVIGRTVRPTGLSAIVRRRRNLIDRLIALVPGMDIYVIPDVRAAVQKHRHLTGKNSAAVEPARVAVDAAAAVFLLASATILGQGIEACGLGEMNQIMIYIMAVILISGFSRYRVTGVMASAASVLLFNFFFTVPRFTFQAVASVYPFTFLTMLLCALTVSSLAARLKRQVRLSKEESEKMQILIAISNKLKLAADSDEILDICAKQVMKLLEKNVIIYHAVGGEVKQPRVYLSNDAEKMAGGILLNEDETAVAGWVCKNCHKAGCTTNTLPGAAGLYIPIQKDGRVFGVIGIDLKEGAPIKPNDKNVLHVILDETAVVLKAQMIHGYL
ncbi:DUF4118 domain-containing protein [Hungatella hathewayi]|uniref:DUF4118 domain-containing protein n=1 Tax=Hungatella hathewayi TaxID=154046 RepID=UPI00210AE079|nr:DUF4118 domain-containing protein [Hungatella hathewayi]MCQ5385695.1 DUF4118 domain-containing protein [Hungatella hathewayi]